MCEQDRMPMAVEAVNATLFTPKAGLLADAAGQQPLHLPVFMQLAQSERPELASISGPPAFAQSERMETSMIIQFGLIS